MEYYKNKKEFYHYEGGTDEIEVSNSELEKLAITLDTSEEIDPRIKIINSKNYKLYRD